MKSEETIQKLKERNDWKKCYDRNEETKNYWKKM